MPGSVIDTANEKVPIVTVLQLLGVELPDDIGTSRSRKLHCPFGDVYHSDGGVSPALRIYPDTNSAYCFSCSSYFSPVNLAAAAMGMDKVSAAHRLLDTIGHAPMDLAKAWKNAVSYEPEPDKALMADALKTYCRRITPDWARRQFEPQIAAALTRCLSILDLVKTPEDVTLWLCKCKVAMERALHTTLPSASERYAVLLESMETEGGQA